MEWITLSNGVKMPALGFGVYQIPADICTEVVCQALSAGYRLIDTAQIYRNEEAVGQALQKSSVPREELFLTGKIWIANAGYEKAKASIDGTLRKLGTDYLDLYIIHRFDYGTPIEETMEALNDLVTAGIVIPDSSQSKIGPDQNRLTFVLITTVKITVFLFFKQRNTVWALTT